MTTRAKFIDNDKVVYCTVEEQFAATTVILDDGTRLTLPSDRVTILSINGVTPSDSPKKRYAKS